jgi:RHS repeat-associated protein
MKYTGHERDLNQGGQIDDLDYMHARYCSPLMGRFLSVDPAGGDQRRPQSFNRYSYAWGNPLKWIDPTGATVSLANLSEEQRAILLQGLNEFTGNTYGIDESLELVLLEVGAESSPTATEFLNTVIESPIEFAVQSGDRNRWVRDTKDVELDFSRTIEYGRVDPRTFNLGSGLVHELFHAVTGLVETPDGTRNTPVRHDFTWTGPTVDFVNDIRRERGLPTRAAYMVQRVGRSGEKIFFDNVNPRRPQKRYPVKRWNP